MGQSEIEKREQNTLYFWQEIQNYIIGRLPIGPELNLLFRTRQNIKTNRLMDFFESFRQRMEEIYDKPLDSNEICSEEFIDVMESIMIKVQSTKSAYKIERFRDILINQLTSPIDNQLALKYVGIIDDLTDIQMKILECSDLHFNKRLSVTKLNELLHGNSDRPVEKDMNKIHLPIGGNEILTSQKEIGFYFDELCRTGLLNHFTQLPFHLPDDYRATEYVPRMNEHQSGNDVDRIFTITSFAHDLLKFVKTSDNRII